MEFGVLANFMIPLTGCSGCSLVTLFSYVMLSSNLLDLWFCLTGTTAFIGHVWVEFSLLLCSCVVFLQYLEFGFYCVLSSV